MARLILAGRAQKIDLKLENPDELLAAFPMWQLKRMTGNRFLPNGPALRDQFDDEIYNLAALDALYEQIAEAMSGIQETNITPSSGLLSDPISPN